MKHDSVTAYRPFERESGVLARTEPDGTELRLHQGERGLWHAHRWFRDDASPDGWRGPVAFGFSLDDLAAMGAAAMAMPVGIQPIEQATELAGT